MQGTQPPACHSALHPEVSLLPAFPFASVLGWVRALSHCLSGGAQKSTKVFLHDGCLSDLLSLLTCDRDLNFLTCRISSVAAKWRDCVVHSQSTNLLNTFRVRP